MNQDTPFDVFISHSSKDVHVASAIKQDLQSLGIRCWKAPDDIRPGESWPSAISRALGACNAMVLVWSSHSIESPEVSKELTIGMRNQLLVIPYKIENIAPSGDWEYHLANSHWLDACGEEIKTANQKLAERLLPIFKRTPSVSEDGKAPGDHSAEKMSEQITEMIWWAYRNGEPKLLDRKGIQLAIKQAGLPSEIFESVKSGMCRNEIEFIQAIGEALEDSEIEVTEEIALEEIRKECCISKKEAEALLRAKVGGLLIRGVEELKHDWILKACSAVKSEILTGTAESNDHGRPPESPRPSQVEQTESLGKKPVTPEKPLDCVPQIQKPRQTQVRENPVVDAVSQMEIYRKYREIDSGLFDEWDKIKPFNPQWGEPDYEEKEKQNEVAEQLWLQDARPLRLRASGLDPSVKIEEIAERAYTLLSDYSFRTLADLGVPDCHFEPLMEGDVWDYFTQTWEFIEPKFVDHHADSRVPPLVHAWYQVILYRNRDVSFTESITWVLAQFYCSGFGCEKNVTKAQEYFESIASSYDKFAVELSKYYLTGRCSDMGIGLTASGYYNIEADFPTDLSKSIHWLCCAMQNGYKALPLCIEYFKCVPNNLADSFLRAIRSNSSPETRFVNSSISLTGAAGVEADFRKGFHLMLEEAKQGNTYAQYTIGSLWLQNTPPNLLEAEKWLAKAAEGGCPWAKGDLEKLKKKK